MLRIRDVYPGSGLFYPGSRTQGQKGAESRIRVRNTVELTQKIMDPDFFPSRMQR